MEQKYPVLHGHVILTYIYNFTDRWKHISPDIPCYYHTKHKTMPMENNTWFTSTYMVTYVGGQCPILTYSTHIA